MKFLYNFIIGIFIGSGAILPGISAGVFCVIFGIYERVLDSVTNIFKDFKKNFLFLLPFVLGGGVGVVLFGNIIKFLFSRFENEAKFIFIGLILCVSIPSSKSILTLGIISFKNSIIFIY